MSRLTVLRKFCAKYIDTRIILLADLIASMASSTLMLLGASLLTNEPSLPKLFLLSWLSFSFMGSLLMFLILQSHHVIIRHSTIRDLTKFIFVVAGKAAIQVSGLFLSRQWLDDKILMMIFVDVLFTFILLVGIRLVMLSVYDALENRFKKVLNRRKVFVFGSGNKAAAIDMRLISSDNFAVAGFITKEADQAGRKLLNKPVLHFRDNDSFFKLAKKYGVNGVLFPTEMDLHNEKENLVQALIDKGIQSYLVPSIDAADDETVLKHIREVKIEDLLGRDEIKISMDLIEKNFKDKVVLVTGAAGSIGSELCRQLATFGVRHLVLIDNSETPMHELRLELEEKFPELSFSPVIGDVRQVERLDYLFGKFHPQIVFHAAAYKHVPLMEENPCEAVLVNVSGSKNVADMCVKYNVEKMVMISTDKAVNPTNIMGCTKRLAEIYVQSLSASIAEGKIPGGTLFVTTRFGNVLGSHGSVIPRFRQQIADGGPVTVTHPDITRYFMTIPEACRLVMEAATISKENNIFVFEMGEPVKIDTLARKMIRLSGLEPDVDIQIKYMGLRPGEKLYEEVLADKESTLPTSHDRIRIAKVRTFDYSRACLIVEELDSLARNVDIDPMVRKMKEFVPEFISNNSVFEKFDR